VRSGSRRDANRGRELSLEGERRQRGGAVPAVLVIEEDYVGRVAGAPYAPVHDGDGRLMVVRSLSKVLGPDLRIALVAGDPLTISRIEGRQRLGPGWVSHVLQQIAMLLLRDRATGKLLARAERTYTERRDALVSALAERGFQAAGTSGLGVWLPLADEAAAVREPAAPYASGLEGQEQPMGLAERDRDRVATPLAATPARQREDVLGRGRHLALGAIALGVQSGPADGVLEDAAVRVAVLVAPDEERVECRPELAAGLGERVEAAPRVVRIRSPLEHVVVDEPLETIGEDRLRYVEVRLEVAEALHAIEGVADDQQRPALA
jgi:hypothetical protein